MRKRFIWCKREKRLVPAHEYVRPVPARSHLSAPSVVNDNIDYLEGQHDGKRYTSKRALRQSYREQGLTEVGDQTQIKPQPKPKPPEKEIDKALDIALSYHGFGA